MDDTNGGNRQRIKFPGLPIGLVFDLGALP